MWIRSHGEEGPALAWFPLEINSLTQNNLKVDKVGLQVKVVEES